MEDNEQYLKFLIAEATGLQMGKDYGFIAGTMHPFGNVRGMMSDSMVNGFIVWKKKGDGYEEKTLSPLSFQEGAEQILAFLKEK